MRGVLIVSGSRGCGVAHRHLDDWLRDLRGKYQDTDWDRAILLHGACPNSPDVDADAWGRARGLVVKPQPADWSRYGSGAGKLRNEQMAEIAGRHRGALLAIWDGQSSGTANMIAHVALRGLDLTVRRAILGRSG